ncbi:PDZ domain-containing protein [Clostridium sp. OS1-26]|uniref:PDZ domain-containing protein n=1 Tax=Clostridium sp. OS1-26 TaxID=3070681 RepID=UPI0027DFAF31|nr:PDZ domain-containing protein [Clostridium sp. OS1-26]WML35592.1 PDZ domain-containing protein [Clostridium sp. OS1-26]
MLKPILKLGISAREITSDMAKQYQIPQGVYVIGVQEFSAAEKSGLQAEDIILKFDGKSVKSVDDINKIKSQHKSGDEVKLDIYRNGKNSTLSLKLTE